MNADYFRFCTSLLKLITDGAATGASGSHHADVIVSSLNNLRLLRELILERKPVHTLEIGLAFGGSALTFLSTLKEVRPDGAFSHTAIDPFQKTVWDCIAVEAIRNEGLSAHFTLHEDFSAYVLPSLVKQNRRFELIYVDGSHLFEDVFLDMYFVCSLLPPGGVVIFDDCTDKHVAKVLKFVTSNYGHAFKEMDLRRFDDHKPLLKRVANSLGFRQARGFTKLESERRNWDAPFVNF